MNRSIPRPTHAEVVGTPGTSGRGRRWRTGRPRLRGCAAALACLVALVGSAAIVFPAAASADAPASCGSKNIKVEDKGNELQISARDIRVEGGATCREAYEVIVGQAVHHPPSGWVVRPGAFKVPKGLTAETAEKGGKKVEYALVGG